MMEEAWLHTKNVLTREIYTQDQRRLKTKLMAEALAFYRRGLRLLKQFPRGDRDYYHNFIRSSFVGHLDETDPDRVKQILSRAELDLQWVCKKYNVNYKANDNIT